MTTISADDRSYLYGDGLFETVRVQGGKPLFLEAHQERFHRSAGALRFPKASIDGGIKALQDLEGCDDGLWRVTVSRDDGRAFGGGSGTVTLRHRPLPDAVESITATVVEGAYFPGDSLAEHKTTNWLRSVIARQRAEERGADEAIMADHQGRLGEASAANLFICLAGQWVTPPAQGLLPGVLRRIILQRAREHGEPIELRPLSVADLQTAEAVAITSSGRGVVAVREVDGQGFELPAVDALSTLVSREYGSP